MKGGRKVLMVLLLTFLLIYGMCQKRRMDTSRKLFLDVAATLKQKNIILSEGSYYVRYAGCSGQGICTEQYEIYKKDLKYRSKYFRKKLSGIDVWYGSFLKEDFSIEEIEHSFSVLGVVNMYGLQPYVLNKFIYDKTRGNDFEKVEKILDMYRNKGKIEYVGSNYWGCSSMESLEEAFYGVNFSKNERCGDEKLRPAEIEKYAEGYKRYFSIPRDLDSIDWEEYMRIHEIYPILLFETEGLSEEELGELRKKIEPYYNKEIMYINIRQKRFP